MITYSTMRVVGYSTIRLCIYSDRRIHLRYVKYHVQPAATRGGGPSEIPAKVTKRLFPCYHAAMDEKTTTPLPGEEALVPGIPRLAISQSDMARLQERNESQSAKFMFHPGDVAGALVVNRGRIWKAARQLGTSGITVRRYIEEFESVAQWWMEAREVLLDEVEDALYLNAVETNNVAAQIFLLKTQARHRGYIENPVDGGSQESQDVAVVDMSMDDI